MLTGPGGQSFDRAYHDARFSVREIDDPSYHDYSIANPALLRKGGGADAFGWDDCIPLRRSDIRLRPRWRSAFFGQARSRKPRLAAAIILTSATLMAACASAVRPPSDDLRASTLASNDARAQRPASTPLPDWRTSRTARATQSATVTGTKTATLGRAPFRGAPDVIETVPNTQEASGEDPRSLWYAPPVYAPRNEGLERPLTDLVAFSSAPFPYDGLQPQGTPFIDVNQNGQRGHRNRRGQILWEETTFNDRRVLVHMPAGFDPNRPAVMVVFFHGYGATLTRDVLARQQVPAQISASGANAVLLAPQFAVDARDPSIGRFWEAGGVARFLNEASSQLAKLQGDPASQHRFAKMPIVLVAYSGGFVPAAWALKDPGVAHRVRGVLMLDAAYGELERFADFAASRPSNFLVSAYTRYTQGQNAALERMLASRGIGRTTELNGTLSRGGAIFLATGDDASHNDFVTQAWTADPIKDILMRLPEFRLREPQAVASIDRRLMAAARD